MIMFEVIHEIFIVNGICLKNSSHLNNEKWQETNFQNTNLQSSKMLAVYYTQAYRLANVKTTCEYGLD